MSFSLLPTNAQIISKPSKSNIKIKILIPWNSDKIPTLIENSTLSTFSSKWSFLSKSGNRHKIRFYRGTTNLLTTSLLSLKQGVISSNTFSTNLNLPSTVNKMHGVTKTRLSSFYWNNLWRLIYLSWVLKEFSK